MPEMIRDGKGRGHILEVDAENRIQSLSTSVGEQSYISQKHAECYDLNHGGEPLTLGSTDWHMVMQFKNTNSNLKLLLLYAGVSWNGGSTTGNKVLWTRNRGGHTVTGNYTEIAPSNLNQTSNNVAVGEFLIWDGVGTGMTYTGGGASGAFAVPQGRKDVDLSGIIVMGINDYVAIEVKGEEIGDFTINAVFYYKEL